jgi:chaperonin cofactor prefoldin
VRLLSYKKKLKPMRARSLEIVLEALRAARSELEGLAADEEWYVPAGDLIEQLTEAEAILETELDA